LNKTKNVSFATAEKNETESKSLSAIPKPEVEAERILNSPNPLAEIKRHLDNLIAGEDDNKLLIFVLLLSGKVPDPHRKQMLLLKGEAGTGKSMAMNIADLFKTKTIGRLSETALDYQEDLQSYEVLKLQELGHMDSDRPLKFVSADDGGYDVEVTVPRRQENANACAPVASGAPFTTWSKHIPPITLITSTTRVGIEPQFHRRNWIITLDDSEEQTKRIRQWKVEREKEEDMISQGLTTETSNARSKRTLTTLVGMIKPCKVMIAFKNSLTQLLPTENVQVRGHYDKLLSLVYLYGVLLQKQLPKLGDSVVLTADRAIEALEISKQAFESMSSVESRISGLMQALVEEGKVKESIIDREERVKIGKRMNKSPKTVLKYLDFLEEEEYVGSIMAGRERVFVLLVSPEEIAPKFLSLKSKLERRGDIVLFMNTEARGYLNDLCAGKGVGEEEREALLRYFP
jgi:hypothetical protein